MTFRLADRLRSWIQDRLLRRVLRNSTYLIISNTLSAVLSIVVANLLGVAGFGVLGIVVTAVSSVNRLLSFRMGELVVKYMGESLERGEKPRAGAVVKVSFIVEGLTSLAAYGVLALLAPLAARHLAGDEALTPIFMLYGLSILGNFGIEAATGVLQVGDHYRSQALVILAQSVITSGLLAVAALTRSGLELVVVAYLAGKLVAGLAPVGLALYWLPRLLGSGWHRAAWSQLPPRRDLARFAFSTNFSGTVNMVARDSESLWVAFFFNELVAGYYKTALALINLVVMPITPFIATTYPEITRSIAAGQWGRLKRLLGRVTLIAAGWTVVVGAGLLLFGQRLLFEPLSFLGRTFQLYRSEFAPAFIVLMILLVGFGLASIFYWNRSLLLAQGEPGFPLKVAFWAMLAKVGLAFILMPRYGYLVEAWLLSGFLGVTVLIITWRGLMLARQTAQTAERTAV